MIEQILRKGFPNAFTRNPETIDVSVDRKNAPFSLSDNHACNRCHELRPERKDCNEEMLKVNNNGHEIAVVNLEEYVGQFGKLTDGKGRCDYLMTESGEGHDKIVFCDLCCYDERHVEKKRKHVRKQMKDAMEFLMRETITAEFVTTCPERICLLAWRDSTIPDESRKAEASMMPFLTVPSSKGRTMLTLGIVEHDFTFIQIKYPTEFVWEDTKVIDERLEHPNE